MIEHGNFSIHGDVLPLDVEPDEWDARRYERAVEANLLRLEQSRAGSVILQHVIAPIVIIPYHLDRGFPGANSDSGPGWPYESPPDDRSVPRTGDGAPLTTISFTPSFFVHPDTPDTRAVDGLHPARTDEVLLHEIVHSVEQQWGTIRYDLVSPSSDDIASICEHRAVRVSNMYSSEQHRPLRGPYNHAAFLSASGHDYAQQRLLPRSREYLGFRGLRTVRRHPASERHDQYVQFEHRLIGEFMLDFPSLTGALEQLPPAVCAYNPFRQFWQGTYDTLLLPAYWAPAELRPDDILSRSMNRTG